MVNINEVLETNQMIEKENLDVRTITLGISLLDCADNNLDELNRKIYNKITQVAANLVETGQEIEKNTVFQSSIKEYQLRLLDLSELRHVKPRKIL